MSKPTHASIYLDDLRDCPGEYLLARNVEECKNLLRLYDGKVIILSLDNDLGENAPEGRHLLNWLEEEIYYGRLHLPYRILVHSANPPARTYMNAAINYMYERYGS